MTRVTALQWDVRALFADSILGELAEIIRAERQCCPFLRFALTLESDNGPSWLEVTGPEGTKEFLAPFLRTDAA